MPTMTFINLAVKDLAESTAFFHTLGFSFSSRFRGAIDVEIDIDLSSEPGRPGASH